MISIGFQAKTDHALVCDKFVFGYIFPLCRFHQLSTTKDYHSHFSSNTRIRMNTEDSSKTSSGPQANPKTTPEHSANPSSFNNQVSKHGDNTNTSLHNLPAKPDHEVHKRRANIRRLGYMSVEASVDQASADAFAHTQRSSSARERRSRANAPWQALRRCYGHSSSSPQFSDDKDEWIDVGVLVEQDEGKGSADNVGESSSEQQEAEVEKEAGKEGRS